MMILHGVLRMPPNCWSGDALDVAQRHSIYCEAADTIEEQAKEIERLKSLITPPSEPATLSGEACYYCGNVMDEEEGSACSACIARVEADLKRPASTTPVRLPADLDLSAMPVDPSSALAEACQALVDCYVGNCSAEVKEAWLSAESALEKRDRAALAIHRKAGE